MRELFDLRISEHAAQTALPNKVGERMGATVRRVVVTRGDPLFAELGRIQREFRARGDLFVTGWICKRTYSRREMEAAELFYIQPTKAFEPTGEQCGTIYDDSGACDHIFARYEETMTSGHPKSASVEFCGVGSRQITPLFLDGRRIPRSVDFARTIADEVIASGRVRSVFGEEGLTGAEFDPVRLSNKKGYLSTDHYQLKAVGSFIELDVSTRAGDKPFDEMGSYRCPNGHTVGNRLLSEVTVQRRSLTGADLTATRQMVGFRGDGVLRPHPMLLISPKAWRAIEKHKLKGLTIEVAHVV